MHRSAALAVPLLLAAAVAPAAAGPVTQGRLADVSFTVPVDNDAYVRLGLRALDGADGDLLAVSLQLCDPDCAAPRYYEGALADGALKVNASSALAKLDTVLGGVPVHIAWSPQDGGPAAAIGGTSGGGNGEDNGFMTYAGVPANARVVVAAGACNGRGAVGDALRVTTSANGNGAAAPLRSLRLRSPGAPTCSE